MYTNYIVCGMHSEKECMIQKVNLGKNAVGQPTVTGKINVNEVEFYNRAWFSIEQISSEDLA